MLGQATPQQTPQQKLPSSSSMSNGATAAFRHMLQIGLHGACIASRGSHGLQRAFRGSLKLSTRGRVLGTYICSGVINSGHENTVAYSGCSASLSNRLRLGGNCATNFGQGSAGRHAKYVRPAICTPAGHSLRVAARNARPRTRLVEQVAVAESAAGRRPLRAAGERPQILMPWRRH